MKIKIKNTLKSRDLWLVAAILIYGFYSGLFGDLFDYMAGKRSSSETARIEIDYGGATRAFEGQAFSGMSVLDALLAASRGGGFEVRYVLLDDSTDIMKIADLAEDGLNGKSWRFYLNGEEVSAAEIHKVQIESGDNISVRFE